MVDEKLLFVAGSLGRLVRKVMDQNLRSIGLTSIQLRALLLIAEEDSANQKRIEEELNITRASVSEMMDNLEKLGLAVREKSVSDGRIRNIVITPKGMEKLNEARALIEAEENELSASINDEEKVSFIKICSKLRNVLEESVC